VAEGLNPTRRYKWFRPRQAIRGSIVSPTPTNWGTLWLFNDTTGSQYIVLRDVAPRVDASSANFYFFRQGKAGTIQTGHLYPYVASTAKRAGIFYFSDEASQFTDDQVVTTLVGSMVWLHQFPIIVLEPGSSFVIQANNAGQSVGVIAVWESIEADELDYAFEM
jgi:hypothetical protein